MKHPFFELVEKRRACHHFIPGQQVPKEDLTKMVEAASLAPSGYNAQPWDFVIITESEGMEALQSIAFDQVHLKEAGAMVVVLGDHEIGRHVDDLLEDWVRLGYCTEEEVPVYRNSIAKNRSPQKKELMAVRNAMLAAMTFIYAAEDLGYQTCPMMGFSHKELTAHLGLPEDRTVALMIAVGKADLSKEPPRLPRKSVESLIHWERW